MVTRHKDEHGLTPKQAMAVEHYVMHGCMSDAYRAAGYSTRGKPATVNRKAIALFDLPHVAARVQELREENAERCALTREEALQILARCARGEEPSEIKETYRNGKVQRIIRARRPIEAIARIARMCGWDKQGPIEAEGVAIYLNIGGPAE